MNRAADHLHFLHDFLFNIIVLLLPLFTTLTSTNRTRVLHKINTKACRNSAVSPRFHCGPRANENFPLFSYLSDSKDQTIIEKVLLANDRCN